MAEENSLERYLSCNMCSDMFRDPVSLKCRHSFCLACLQQYWKYNKNRRCPACKRTSLKREAGVNFALKEFADSFAGRLKSDTEKELEIVCATHKEDPKKYCREEERALCSVCDFPHNDDHKVVSIGLAVNEMKDQLKSDIISLQDRRKKFKEARETFNEMVQHSKKQVLASERKIRVQFNKLKQLLKEEEESRLAALKEEEVQRWKAMAREKIEETLTSISDTVYDIEEQIVKDDLPFLGSCKALNIRIKALHLLSDPQLLPGVLINEAKHLGNLSFRVWDKIRSNISFSPVILDPHTAHRCLYLSDDLAGVSRGDLHQQQVPDNPERHSKYNFVLGCEGFSSGRHSWDVEVTDVPGWIVGLVKESVDRRGDGHATTKNGFWCLQHCNGKYTNGFGEKVKFRKSLRRIRVQLIYEDGDVSFYDPEDTTHIYSYSETFTEKLFPCFSISKAIDAKSKTIRICQIKMPR